MDKNNEPFLINGDAAWSLMVRLTRDEADFYLEDRKQRGFNAILVNLIEHHFGGPQNVYGEHPFLSPSDFAAPNERYFAHAAWVINTAREKGMLVILAPAYLGFDCGEQGWCQELISNGEKKAREYGRYLGRRYSKFDNILWMHGGDVEPGKAAKEVNAIVDGIKEANNRHLHTAHCRRQKSALDCYDEKWLDINTTYSDCTLTPSKIRRDYHRGRTMPFLYIEGRYENEGASPQCLRSQAYWAILGGSVGHVFGNRPIWLFDQGWHQALGSEGSQSMTVMEKLFQSRAWHQLTPDWGHALLVSGYGEIDGSSYVAAASASDGGAAIVYLPAARTVTLNLTRVSRTDVNAWWFNPANGSVSSVGSIAARNAVDFTPPEGGDWVLVLDDASRNLPQPGHREKP